MFSGSSGTIAHWTYFFFGASIEELIARCLALLAMLTAWGENRSGLLKAVLYLSILFAASHLFNVINTPPGLVVFQVILAVIPGMLYASLFLATRSLWPPILLHWVTNALVNAKIADIPGYVESPTVWVWWAIALIPLLVFSLYLVWKAPHPDPMGGEGLRMAA